MKRLTATMVLVFLSIPVIATANNTPDPPQDEYEVCVEQYCHVFCPAGDMSLCFCIKKNGEPLALPPSEVFLKIECNEGDLLYLCPDEELEKAAYLSSESCINNPDCGTSYCWYFRLGGYCEESMISLRLKNETESFFKLWFPIKSPDINGDGAVDSSDESALLESVGTNTVNCDLNCDLIVDDADHMILRKHLNHSCDEQIGTEESTWGSIKSIYR